MSVDYSAIVGYGYIFSQDTIKYSALAERAVSVYDTVDFDPFDYFFKVNAYGSNSDIFLGHICW